MSDDLVVRLRLSWDADRSIISQTDRWMTERKEAADRIEELEAENKRLRDEYRYLGKDGKPILARELEDQRDELKTLIKDALAAGAVSGKWEWVFEDAVTGGKDE